MVPIVRSASTFDEGLRLVVSVMFALSSLSFDLAILNSLPFSVWIDRSAKPDCLPMPSILLRTTQDASAFFSRDQQ